MYTIKHVTARQLCLCGEHAEWQVLRSYLTDQLQDAADTAASLQADADNEVIYEPVEIDIDGI